MKNTHVITLMVTLSFVAGPAYASPPSAAIDGSLLDLIDQKAPLYFNSAWNLNINQFKAWLATIAWAEAGKAGYGAHSGGNPKSQSGDIFRHKVLGSLFHFSTGIGPFQLDRGSVDQWELWPTGHKIDPDKAVISALKVHNQTFPLGYALTDFAWNSPWLAVNPNYTPGGASSNWAAVTGTDWVAHRAGPAPLDWPSIKSALAQNAAADPRSLYDYNVESKGLMRWNITAAQNVRAETGRAVIFDGDFPTWLIRSRRHDETGSERCRYYYAFRSDLGPYPIEVWVYDNSQNPDRFKYIFIRECYPSVTYGALPDHREIRPDGYAYAGEPTLSAPAIILGETLSVTLTANPASGTAPLNGVDFTATVSGTATGTINYTFYANRSDDGNDITPGYCFKIDHINPDDTGGNVIHQGIATDWGSTPFTVYDVYNYTSAGTYTAKVIAERGSCQAEKRITITVNAPPCSVTMPTMPSGPSSGQTGQSLDYSTSDSTCSNSHSVQYRFDWGDGSAYSSWGSATRSKTYSSAGTYTIKAQARCASTLVESGWSSGMSFTITSPPQTGNLQVTLGPAGAVSAGAQWNVDGGTWQNSGATVTGLSVGSHTVNYKSITGWIVPPSEQVTINISQTTAISRNYMQQTGNLQVTLGPAGAISAGAQWNVDGGSWSNSGYTQSGLSVGQHTVEFKSISGWNTPSNQTVQINGDQTTYTTGTYTAAIIGDFCGANFGLHDGYVDVWDLMQFANHWHTDTGDSNWDAKFDLAGPNFGDLDGYVDVWDLTVFADHWHEGQKP